VYNGGYPPSQGIPQGVQWWVSFSPGYTSGCTTVGILLLLSYLRVYNGGYYSLPLSYLRVYNGMYLSSRSHTSGCTTVYMPSPAIGRHLEVPSSQKTVPGIHERLNTGYVQNVRKVGSWPGWGEGCAQRWD